MLQREKEKDLEIIHHPKISLTCLIFLSFHRIQYYL